MGMQDQELSLGFKVELGEQCHGTLFGGPFRRFEQTRRLVGIKMAEEIDHPHDFAVDTEDYSVPTQEAMQDGIAFALRQFHAGNDVYVGCMGGIGRTGLFMGCMAKVMREYNLRTFGVDQGDSVKYVRARFKQHAIETPGQQHFIADFDVEPAMQILAGFNPVPERVEVTVEKTKEVEVVKYVYLSPLQWFQHIMFGTKPQ